MFYYWGQIVGGHRLLSAFSGFSEILSEMLSFSIFLLTTFQIAFK